MNRVALIKMPWGHVNSVSLALGILKPVLERENIPTDVFYLNVRFVSYLKPWVIGRMYGIENYGELAFKQHLFNSENSEYDKAIRMLLRKLDQEKGRYFEPLLKDQLVKLRFLKGELNYISSSIVPKFIDDCLENIKWDNYYLVGFSCTIWQFQSSLLLAKKIKEKYPQVKIVLGGPCVFGEMGEQTLRDFDWIDYIVDGEGEIALPQLAKNVANGKYYEDVPGVSFRKDGDVLLHKEMPPPACLEDSPIPDYSDYYNEVNACGLDEVTSISRMVFFESSRGCWWGEKSHCRFCGFNNHMMKYHSKSPEKILNELKYMSEKYAEKIFFATDSVIDLEFFDTMLPKLAEMKHDIKLFYQVKSDLKKDQLVMLKNAGVTKLVAGIENLNTYLLKLMYKGVSSLQNVQFLKLCFELGLRVDWNFMYAIPGEEKSCYDQIIELIPMISHLESPFAATPVNLVRYSPYFNHPEQYGISNIKPSPIQSYFLPEDKVKLEGITYNFEFDCDTLTDSSYVEPLVRSMDNWRKAYMGKKIYCYYKHNGDLIEICDNRPLVSWEADLEQRKFNYDGYKRDIYLYCNESRTVTDISNYLEKNGVILDNKHILDVLSDYVDKKLMYNEGAKYLSLAVAASDAEVS